MILDDHVMPLTRAWCLFELLQTAKLQQEQSSFSGLWLCTTSGVLHQGKAGVDIAMRIAEHLAVLRLEDAQASVQKDKDMIDHLVSKMPGGFPAMNAFVRSEIRKALLAMKGSFDGDFSKLLQVLDESVAVEERASKILGLSPRPSREGNNTGVPGEIAMEPN